MSTIADKELVKHILEETTFFTIAKWVSFLVVFNNPIE